MLLIASLKSFHHAVSPSGTPSELQTPPDLPCGTRPNTPSALKSHLPVRPLYLNVTTTLGVVLT